jgi:hypothetical protein
VKLLPKPQQCGLGDDDVWLCHVTLPPIANFTDRKWNVNEYLLTIFLLVQSHRLNRGSDMLSHNMVAALRSALGTAGNPVADEINDYFKRGTVGNNPAGNVRRIREGGPGALHRTTIWLDNETITITDGGASGGIGSSKLYTFPEGALDVGIAFSSFTIVAASGIGATATVKHALGTAQETTNDTLDSTQANVLPSTNTVLSGSAGTAKGLTSTKLGALDGSTTPAELWLNFGIADAGITANSSIVINGFVTILWSWAGDESLPFNP